MDENKQNAIENALANDISCDGAMISISAQNGFVEAYTEKCELPLINVKRQPASAIKPLLVYAPAINENIVTPSTVILDENVSINGYSPKNIGEKEHGYVSVKDALSNSYNIPAVKILSYIGIDKAKAYLERQNIDFDEKDNSLALALGGMTYGITLKNLTNCYQTFANGGKFTKSKFISYIVDSKGRVIYKNNEDEKTIYRNDTAFLVTDMLHKCSKTGTSKRLSDLNYYIASKTGTSSLSKKNIDAYNISYTTEDVVGCWMGNVDNSPIEVVGGGMPTACVKDYLKTIYSDHTPKNFEVPSSIVEEYIDVITRDNEHIIYKASSFLPDRYKEKAYFSRFNQPKSNYSENLTVEPIEIKGKIQNGIANITFNTCLYNSYDIYMSINGEYKLIDTIQDKNGEYTFTISQEPNKICSYYVVTKIKNYKDDSYIESKTSNVLNLYYQKQ